MEGQCYRKHVPFCQEIVLLYAVRIFPVVHSGHLDLRVNHIGAFFATYLYDSDNAVKSAFF